MAPRKTKKRGKKPASSAARPFTNAQLNALHGLEDYSERPIGSHIAEVLQEARALEALVARYGKKLRAGSRLDARTMTSLGERRALLEVAEKTWLTEHLSLASRAVRKTRAEAELFKRDVIAALRYFVADDEALQRRIDAIPLGTAMPGLCDDLKNLAPVLVGVGAALKKAALPKNAAAKCIALSEALAPAAAEMATDVPADHLRLLRNRAYWYLRQAMDAIRAAGRYVFRNEPALLVQFRASSARASVPNRYAYAFESPTVNGDGRAQPN